MIAHADMGFNPKCENRREVLEKMLGRYPNGNTIRDKTLEFGLRI